jgi:ATP-dependent DNA helicase RecQ
MNYKQLYVEELTDDETLDEVMDFFKKSETDSIEDALKEYGNEFSKEDLQLMKIYFISEHAF